MVLTRLQTQEASQMPNNGESSSSSQVDVDPPPPPGHMEHFTPPEHFIPNPGAELIVNAAGSPGRRPRNPRAGDPPQIEDVLTQQTAVLARMMEQLQNRDPPARAPAVNDPADPPEDPNIMWERLALPSETNFVVPSNGMVQHMATSLFARVPTLQGRDQHEARFVLQAVSLWPDLTAADRQWVFQRLNVYCIVAALGWPAATAACAFSTASIDYVLPPGVVLPQREQRPPRMQRQNAQQPAAAAAPAPAPPPAQRQNRNKRQRNQPRGGGRAGNRQ